ncbi:hypothetical protein R8Z50_11865 [Longispora sp. K20-0274]|uniref:hypothetical protein n=1 Tax=Longispora sp. K20-0274 TaxID=3088255 RepID=UPI003999D061
MINYDGKSFRSSAAETSRGKTVPVGHYHQDDDLVWAEFAGGAVRNGFLVGTADADGVMTLSYSQVLDTGEVISGRCTTTPTLLEDGRLRLREEWHRFGSGASGVSYIDEIRV